MEALKECYLSRKKQSPQKGTLGLLSIEKIEVCQTLELPWVDKDNNNISDKFVSCINTGRYLCVKRFAQHLGYEVFEITGVVGRDSILIHKASWLRDILGCVGLGTSSGEESGQFRIYDSKKAFDRFMFLMKDEKQFYLTITNDF